jgi:hypothetical protein
MQVHLFVLMILINGQPVSDDMYFRDIHRCNFFVDAIVRGIRKSSAQGPNRTIIEGYCTPRLIRDVAERPDIMIY